MQHILYRQKEQFSDGVGYGWIDGLKAHAEKHVKHDRNLLFSNPIFSLVVNYHARHLIFLIIGLLNFPIGD